MWCLSFLVHTLNFTLCIIAFSKKQSDNFNKSAVFIYLVIISILDLILLFFSLKNPEILK
jgi:hypothetical protein